jgi:hypothetical protein
MKTTLFPVLIIFIQSCSCDCEGFKSGFTAIHFKFRQTGTGSFSQDEIDTLRIYKLNKNTIVKIDSVDIYDGQITFSSTNRLFSDQDYWAHDYLLKTQASPEFHISDIEIQTHKSNHRCGCEVNDTKKLKVNGIGFDLSGKANEESIVELTK